MQVALEEEGNLKGDQEGAGLSKPGGPLCTSVGSEGQNGTKEGFSGGWLRCPLPLLCTREARLCRWQTGEEQGPLVATRLGSWGQCG